MCQVAKTFYVYRENAHVVYVLILTVLKSVNITFSIQSLRSYLHLMLHKLCYDAGDANSRIDSAFQTVVELRNNI